MTRVLYRVVFVCAATSFPALRAVAMVVLLAMTLTDQAQAANGREATLFNDDWRFHAGDPDGLDDRLDYARLRPFLLPSANGFRPGQAPLARPAGEPADDVSFVQPTFDDRAWQSVALPHDWAIAGPFEQGLPGATGKRRHDTPVWYRKRFRLAPGDRARRLTLRVEGAMSYASVWLNGRFVGGWPYGYTTFEVDLTEAARFDDDNCLVVRLHTPDRAARWYPGGGLYRDVYLLKTDAVHLDPWGTVVTTAGPGPVPDRLEAAVALRNESSIPQPVQVHAVFRDEGAPDEGRLGRASPVAAAESAVTDLPPGGGTIVRLSLTPREVRPWSPDDPHLYRVTFTVLRDGRPIDRYEVRTGFRSARFDAGRGFVLNGGKARLQGVCLHGDLGALGIATDRSAWQRRLVLLKQMGCNALRTSHNPPPPVLLDLADEMGFLVMDEAFDCWDRGKTPGDYHLLFADWHEPDLRALVRRDRNHPSVVLWSIGNEIPNQSDAVDGPAKAAMLREVVRQEDPTRPVTAACSETAAAYNGFGARLDVFGFNYHPSEYAPFRLAHPQQPVVGSETSSTVSSRGEYFFPLGPGHDRQNFQVSSYDSYAPPWATSPQAEFRGQDHNGFVAGEFVWTGIDYLGEPVPYDEEAPSRSSYFGILDLCGFKKDRFYLYQSRWRPDLPMAHLLPHWTWPERIGQVTPVRLYTTGDAAELFLNGRSLGRRRKGPGEYQIAWDDVRYEPGELRAVAYRAGRRWAEDRVRTAGAPKTLSLTPEQPTAGTGALAFVTATVRDGHGVPVPRGHPSIRFRVAGPGELVATDNGDATDLAPFADVERRAYQGLAQAIVRVDPGAPPGATITVEASSPGLAGAVVRLRVARPVAR